MFERLRENPKTNKPLQSPPRRRFREARQISRKISLQLNEEEAAHPPTIPTAYLKSRTTNSPRFPHARHALKATGSRPRFSGVTHLPRQTAEVFTSRRIAILPLRKPPLSGFGLVFG